MIEEGLDKLSLKLPICIVHVVKTNVKFCVSNFFFKNLQAEWFLLKFTDKNVERYYYFLPSTARQNCPVARDPLGKLCMHFVSYSFDQ